VKHTKNDNVETKVVVNTDNVITKPSKVLSMILRPKKIKKIKISDLSESTTISEMEDSDFESLIEESFVEEMLDKSGSDPEDIEEEEEFWKCPKLWN